jgi:hypothetical protein
MLLSNSGLEMLVWILTPVAHGSAGFSLIKGINTDFDQIFAMTTQSSAFTKYAALAVSAYDLRHWHIKSSYPK